jgi:hypothetical protein
VNSVSQAQKPHPLESLPGPRIRLLHASVKSQRGRSLRSYICNTSAEQRLGQSAASGLGREAEVDFRLSVLDIETNLAQCLTRFIVGDEQIAIHIA